METEGPALKVCVCGAASSQVPLVVNAMATGQVFGATQTLKLTLHDSPEKASDLAEEVLDLLDSCSPLLMDVEGETDADRSLCGSDVILMVLPTMSLDDVLSDIAHYADVLNRIPRTRQKAVIVVSHLASTAAGILCVLAPQLSHRLVTAVEIPPDFFHYAQVGRGGHLLTKTVSDHVSVWWSRLKMYDPMMEDDDRFHGFSGMLVRYLQPSTTATTSRDKQITSSMSGKRAHSEQDFQDFCAAMKHLEISSAQLIHATLSCQL